MKEKYELTYDMVNIARRKLYRIRALRSFGDVKAGDLGGYVESESNLSHSGHAWISGDSEVFGDGRVSGNAQICGNCEVYEQAHVYGNARIYGGVSVFGSARVYGNARLYDNVWAYMKVCIYGNAWILGDTEVYGINIKLNSGIWNKILNIDEQEYVISTTLQKILLE